MRCKKDVQIEKSSDNNTISIVTPQNLITIGLNITVHKAIVSTGNFATHEYKITILGSEITAGTTRQVEDPIESTSDRSKKLIEPYIFELVSNLAQEEIRVLACDTKFMLLLESINTKFEGGYKRLMGLRKMS